MYIDPYHLSYCTNIFPAETWEDTLEQLVTQLLPVRDQLYKKRFNPPTHLCTLEGNKTLNAPPFAIGLRLSARAARELLERPKALLDFQDWLKKEGCYVYTINGFPYGAFHHTTVKEEVYRPDWTQPQRLQYTKDLFTILSILCPQEVGGSVSTLPGSFKEFHADEERIFTHLSELAIWVDHLSENCGKDLHLGLEPEPLGLFENTPETLAFFERFRRWANAHQPSSKSKEEFLTCLKTRIGLNYDTCHFALAFESPSEALSSFQQAEIRISKIHLSNAISFDPKDSEALARIALFNEPTYLHQVQVQDRHGALQSFKDLPEFIAFTQSQANALLEMLEARVHFHIPLYEGSFHPFSSTLSHTLDTLSYLHSHPSLCTHLEMETYTYQVLPEALQKPLTEQITDEYVWTLNQLPHKCVS